MQPLQSHLKSIQCVIVTDIAQLQQLSKSPSFNVDTFLLASVGKCSLPSTHSRSSIYLYLGLPQKKYSKAAVVSSYVLCKESITSALCSPEMQSCFNVRQTEVANSIHAYQMRHAFDLLQDNREH